MPFQLVLHGDSLSELVQELRWLDRQLSADSVADPSAAAQQEVVRGLQGAGLPVARAGNGSFGLLDPVVSSASGPVTHPPEERQRINQAAASAKEALAKERAAKKAAGKAPPKGAAQAVSPTPDVAPGQDLSGDPEEGDAKVDPDNEPADPLAPDDTAGRTPAEKRKVLTGVLMQVHAKEEAKVGKGKCKEVSGLCQKFGAAKVAAIPDDKVDTFWDATQVLCRKWGVPFVDEAPAAGDML